MRFLDTLRTAERSFHRGLSAIIFVHEFEGALLSTAAEADVSLPRSKIGIRAFELGLQPFRPHRATGGGLCGLPPFSLRHAAVT